MFLCRLGSAFRECCKVLCHGGGQINPEDPLDAMETLKKADLVCNASGTIIKLGENLTRLVSTPILERNIFAYRVEDARPPTKTGPEFYKFTFLSDYDFSFSTLHLNDRVYLLFTSIIPLPDLYDSLIHWVGNTANIARAAIEDVTETRKLYLYSCICDTKVRLCAIKDETPNWASASASHITSVVAGFAKEWTTIFPMISHRFVIDLSHDILISTEINVLSLLLKEAYLLLVSDILNDSETISREPQGELQYVISINHARSSTKPSLSIELRRIQSTATPLSQPAAFLTDSPLAYRETSVAQLDEIKPSHLRRTSSTATSRHQFTASAEVESLEKLCITYQGEEASFRFVFQDITQTSTVFPAECAEIKASAGELACASSPGLPVMDQIGTPSVKFMRKLVTPPVLFGSFHSLETVSATAPVSAITSVPTTPNTIHVLVVDDESASRKLAAKLLDKGAHTHDVAEDGDEAVLYFCRSGLTFAEVRAAYAANSDPNAFVSTTYKTNIVFMDQQMKRQNGTDATPIIHWLTKGERPVYVFPMSANTTSADLARYKEAGMISDHAINKPFSITTINSVISYINTNGFYHPYQEE